jgi:AcrR family transcriptional regulator
MTTVFRKAPQQKRSQDLVDDVMEATARLIPDFGFDRATTNKIAELAGVSIGSLYRYFPNKEAIFISLFQRVEENHRQQLRKALEMARDLPPRSRVEPVVGAIVDLVMKRRKLVLVLYSHAPQLGALDYLVQSRQRFRGEIELVLQEFSSHIPKRSPHTAARLIVGCVHGVLEDLVQDDGAEQVVDTVKKELAELFCCYLFAE